MNWLKTIILRESQRWKIFVPLILVLAAMLFNVWVYRDSLGHDWHDLLRYERPLPSAQHFYERIRDADRIVVRDGGYNCCHSVKNDPVLFTITNSNEIKMVFDHIQFIPFTNELAGACMCCGYPGIDWYKGPKRIALTSLQHGHSIRWKEFGTSYFGPFRFCGDIPLKLESAIWMLDWLKGHGVTNGTEFTEQYKEKLIRNAKRVAESD